MAAKKKKKSLEKKLSLKQESIWAGLKEKDRKSIYAYAEKYKATPDACYVHPTMLEGVAVRPAPDGAVRPASDGTVRPAPDGAVRPASDGEVPQNGVALQASPIVRPNHFWIGVEEVQPQ